MSQLGPFSEVGQRPGVRSVHASTADMRRPHRHVGFVPISDIEMERAANEGGSSAIGIVSEFTSSALARPQVGGSIAAGTRGPQLVNFCFNRVGPSRNSGAGSLNWVTNIEDR